MKGLMTTHFTVYTIVVSSSSAFGMWSNMEAERVANPLKVFMGQLRPDITQQTISDVTAGLGLVCKSIHVVPGSRFQVWRLRIQS